MTKEPQRDQHQEEEGREELRGDIEVGDHLGVADEGHLCDGDTELVKEVAEDAAEEGEVGVEKRTDKRVSFMSESGQIILDESYLKKKINKREFEFLAFNDDFNLVPVKQSSSYDVMTTIILFDREIKLPNV